ncbi:hypothetical protein BDF20DRAFT_876853 [Mycotypha africana]|uniref:uncharacterized protein n=1 Tax=Mycotypha africana TaxID=64632 RepID=UPI0023011E7F|nr:uncharacterized protein BDF20DRAFT_876853 [Mycotypha africana]KAI8975092.1 hypothetical protein BDF20DRAFT_876853 [Mycotypha africana]
MNHSNTNWLDSLAKHSIFEVKDAYRDFAEKLKAKQTSADNSSPNCNLARHTRVIALRDNDLFVAVGSTIRVIYLTAFKDAWLKASKENESNNQNDAWINSIPYKILDTPDINFTIEFMSVNKNGRLLSVGDQNRLTIICLPRQSFSDVSSGMLGMKVDCRTLSIGSKYFEENEILKTEWHPLSETGTHLVVLSNDNMLRIFDISADIDTPEQSFDLSPAEKSSVSSNQSNVGFSVDVSDCSEDAVTFSLGGASKEESGWEPFTIFYALRSGHIYALCPVLPSRSIVSRDHLDKLSCIADVKYEQANASESKDHKSLAPLYNLQSKWINALLKSARIAKRSTLHTMDGDSLFVTNDSSQSKYKLQRQGPFKVNNNRGTSMDATVTDILYTNFDSINIISLAFTDGTVDNYILGSEIDAEWSIPVVTSKDSRKLGSLLADASLLPRASCYETLTFKPQNQPKFRAISLVANPLYNGTYFAYHAGGVHAVCMYNWAQELARISHAYEENSEGDAKRDLEKWMKQKTPSEVRTLINTAPFGGSCVPILGVAVLTDIYLSYSLLAITSDYGLIAREMNLRRQATESKEMRNAVKEQLRNIATEDGNEKDDSLGYQPVLPLPAFQPPSQLDTLPKQAKIVLPADVKASESVSITEETLRFFTESAENIRRETRDIHKAAVKISNRLAIQQKEFERQVRTVREIYMRLKELNSPEAKQEQQQRINELSQNHNKLRIRIDEQLRTLVRSYQPALSQAEKEWIEKLEKLLEQISGSSGYAARVEKLQSQLKEVEAQNQKNNNVKSSKLNPSQLKNILSTLNDQEKSIKDVSGIIEKLESRFSSLTV